MEEMSNPDSLSPNRLNQALISETLNEFPHFEFVSANGPEVDEQNTAQAIASAAKNAEQDQLMIYPVTIKRGGFLFYSIIVYMK